MPWASLAWALVALVLGLTFVREFGPAAKALVETLNTRHALKLEALKIAQIEQRTAAELANANVAERTAAEQAQLKLQTAQLDTQRRVLEASPQAQAEFAAAQRQIDLDAHEETALQRARLELPPDMAALTTKGYETHLQRAMSAPFHPKSPQQWLADGK